MCSVYIAPTRVYLAIADIYVPTLCYERGITGHVSSSNLIARGTHKYASLSLVSCYDRQIATISPRLT